MMVIEICPYTPDRATEIANLFHRAVHAVDPAIYTPQQQEAWAPSPPDVGQWTTRLARKQPWLAMIAARVAGFIELDGDGHIDCLYTHPDFQRQGVAAALYAHLEAEARNRRLTRLYVEASLVAKPFFVRHGFCRIKTNQILRSGVTLINDTLEKKLYPGPE